jgi:hypothetical protein
VSDFGQVIEMTRLLGGPRGGPTEWGDNFLVSDPEQYKKLCFFMGLALITVEHV